MPRDVNPENTPASLLLAEIGALQTAVRNAPKSRQLAAARETLAKARVAREEAEQAVNRYYAARGDGVVVHDDPRLSRLQKARAKAVLALEDAQRKVEAVRIAHAPAIYSHLAHHAPTLRRHLADVTAILNALAAIIKEGGDIATANGKVSHPDFSNDIAISTAAIYLKAKFR